MSIRIPLLDMQSLEYVDLRQVNFTEITGLKCRSANHQNFADVISSEKELTGGKVFK